MRSFLTSDYCERVHLWWRIFKKKKKKRKKKKKNIKKTTTKKQTLKVILRNDKQISYQYLA